MDTGWTRSHPEMESLSAALACLSALYLLLPRVSRGLPRLLCVLPCFPILAMVPFCTRSSVLRSIHTFMFLWVCPTKLLLRCWDIAPDVPGDGLLYFFATTVMPLRVKARLEGQKLSFMRRFQDALLLPSLQFLCFFAALNVVWRLRVSIWVEHAIYCLLIYLGMGGVLGLFTGLTSLLLKVELYPYFDKPFLASSLSDFWGRRWNCLVSYMLRETVYNPVLRCMLAETSDAPAMDATIKKTANGSRQKQLIAGPGLDSSSSAKVGIQPISAPNIVVDGQDHQKNERRVPLPARAVAMFASFVVSGLFHELIYYCLTQTNPTWEVTMYFVLHGVATILQVFLRRKFPNRRNLPKPIAIVCTLSFIYFSAVWLFLPPVFRSGALFRILAEFRQLQDMVVHIFSRQGSGPINHISPKQSGLCKV